MRTFNYFTLDSITCNTIGLSKVRDSLPKVATSCELEKQLSRVLNSLNKLKHKTLKARDLCNELRKPL